MRRNPRLPRSSVITFDGKFSDDILAFSEEIADGILAFVRMKAAQYPSLDKDTRIFEIISEVPKRMMDAIDYKSSSGVHGSVFFYFCSKDIEESFEGGAIPSRTSGSPSSVFVFANRWMRISALFMDETREDLIRAIVHEIGHVIDKNTRYSASVKDVLARKGFDAYLNSREEIQAESQAAFYAMKRYASSSGKKIPASNLEEYIEDFAPYYLVMRYREYTEDSKRIFLLYLYNALNDEGLLS